VTRSEFFLAVDDEFGEVQGRSLLRDFVIDGLDHRTASEALAEGVAPRAVWFALCQAMQVPEARWHGAGLPQPTPDTPR
jgi:hypothetical protein